MLWIDAHADINTPQTSLTNNSHGMPVAGLLKLFNTKKEFGFEVKNTLKPQQIVYIGLRDIDSEEIKILRDLNIKYFKIECVRELGMDYIMKESLEYLNVDKLDLLHLSLDIDGIDPDLAPATGTPVPQGLNYRDMEVLFKHLNTIKSFRGMDLVEFNPYEANNPTEILQSIACCKKMINLAFPPFIDSVIEIPSSF